jgi:hypothetical protein
MRRKTVSEFIRETKPDWDHVRTLEKRTSTRPFSGPAVVQVTGPKTPDSMVPFESFAEQVDIQDRQNLGLEEPMTFWEEETKVVEDNEPRTASGLPTGD